MDDLPIWGPTTPPRAFGTTSTTDAFGHPGIEPATQLDPFPVQPPSPAHRMRKRVGSAVAAVVAIAAKFGTALKALLIALPNLKFIATAGTALVSVAAYTLFFPWTFAVGLVILLFIHEMGHVIQLRREGIQASAPMFIPFLGAMIAAKSMGENALAEARVGLAGPILGTLGAAAVGMVAALMEPSSTRDMLLALAYFGFFINLFNLIPVVPFDGGRAMAAVAPGMWFLGIAGLLAMAIIYQSLFMALFIVLALREMPIRWRQLRSRSLVSAAYYRVPRASRIKIGMIYVALIVALGVGMDLTHILVSEGHSFTSI